MVSPNREVLAVSVRPYYLPGEFSHVISLCLYIPPSANSDAACIHILSVVARLQTQHPGAFVIMSSDFNHVTLDTTLAVYQLVVDCQTRKNRTIDQLYTNV